MIRSFAVVEFVLSVTRSQEVINNKMSYFAAQPLSGGEVKAEMLPGENPAQRSLFCRSREYREGALYPRQDFRGDVKVEMIPLEEGPQHGCPGSANDRVRARVGGIGGRLAYLRKPIRVNQRVGVVVRISSPDGGHRPPEIVCVFGVVEGNHTVGQCQVKQGKQAGTLRRRKVPLQGCRLGDLVPIVLNCSIPEATSQRLVCGTGSTVDDSQCFDFIESIAVLITGQRRGRAGTKLIRALEGKRRHLGPMSELRLFREIRWR